MRKIFGIASNKTKPPAAGPWRRHYRLSWSRAFSFELRRGGNGFRLGKSADHRESSLRFV